MPDQTTAAPHQLLVPNLPNVAPGTWTAFMKKRPAAVPRAEWQNYGVTLFEIAGGRLVPSSRIKSAQKIAVAAKASDETKKRLDDALTQVQMEEATESGKAKIAAQAPVKFVHPAESKAPKEAPAVAAKTPAPRPAPAAHADHAAPKRAAAATAATATTAAAAASTKKGPAGLTPAEAAAYRKIVDDAKAGSLSHGTTYGKLNFAYEIAKRSGDEQARGAIGHQMNLMRPMAPGPGRYGVSDKEYDNYARVWAAMSKDEAIPQANLKAAMATAKKYGHTELSDMLAEKLPKEAVAAAPKKVAPPTGARPSHPAAKVAAAAPAAGAAVAAKRVASGEPGKPESVSDQDWATFKSVLEQLGKGIVPPTKDLNTSAQVSASMQAKGKSYPATNTLILHTLALGDAATVKQLAEARRLSISERKPDAVVKIFSQKIVMAGIKANNPADMKIAEQVARQSGQTKTADAFAQKLKSFAPAAGGTAVATAAAAATTVAVARRTHQGAPAPAPSRPTGPSVVVPRTQNVKYTEADSKAVDEGMKKLDRYEKHDLLNAADKMAKGQPLTLKELTSAQAAADKAGLKVPAARFGKAASDLHAKMAAEQDARLSKTKARLASRPTPAQKPAVVPPPPPVVLAQVPVTPNAATVKAQAAPLGVPPAKVAEVITTAKSDGPKSEQAKKIIEQGAVVSQQAASSDPQAAAQARGQIDVWVRVAKTDSPEAVTAQQALTGVAAANAVTVATAKAAPPRPAAPPEGEDQIAEPAFVAAPAPAPRGAPARTRAPKAPPPIENAPAPSAPPPILAAAEPAPAEVADVPVTPPSKSVKVAAAAAGVTAAATAGVILASRSGDQGAKNNMQAGAALNRDLQSEDPETRSAAQATLAELKQRKAAGDKTAEAALAGTAAAAASADAIKKQTPEEVRKEVRKETMQASIAGPPPENTTGLVVGALALALGGGYMLIKSKGGKKAA